MKKVFILLACALSTFCLSAQMKGEMVIGEIVGMSAGVQTISYNFDGQKDKASQPKDFVFYEFTEFGYFVANNLKLGVEVGFQDVTTYTEKVDNRWLKNHTDLGFLGLNMEYYVKITDRFYYTPEFYVDMTFGTYSVEDNGGKNTYGSIGANVGILPAKFEVKLVPQIGLTFSLLNIAYASLTSFVNVGGQVGKFTTGVFDFNMIINPSVGVKYYLPAKTKKK